MPTVVAFLLAVGSLASVGLHSGEVRRQTTPRSYLALPDGGRIRNLPYVWERQKGSKHLVVLGTQHVRNPDSPMYPRIESTVDRLRPQIILHEGVAPPGLESLPRDRAISLAADLAFAVHLAHGLRIPTASADAPQDAEIRELLRRHRADEVLVFLTAQRFIGDQRNPDPSRLAADYPAFYASLVVAGLPAKTSSGRWPEFQDDFRRVTGHALALREWTAHIVDPTRDIGPLNEMARSSEAIRDRYLLASIADAMRTHDRVAVIFGGWHVRAIEPLLDAAMPQ